MKLPAPVRRVLDPLSERIPVPIISGVNVGRWWALASAGSGYASGTRARAQMHILQALLRRGDVAWDVGAHHGYVSLMASRRAGREGSVHAFEPSQLNGRILSRHLRWNGCENATVHALALGDSDGYASFGGGDTSKMHALGQGDERVRVRTGAAMIREGLCAAPTFLKVDVEGAEAGFLAGLGDELPRHARLVIAMHSAQADRDCTAWLTARGFVLRPSRALEASRDGTWRSDPDLYAFGPTADTDGAMQHMLRACGEIRA